MLHIKKKWPSVEPREASKEFGKSKIVKGYMKNFFSGKEKHEKLKVDIDLKAISDYSQDDKNIAMQLVWLGHAAFLLQSIVTKNHFIYILNSIKLFFNVFFITNFLIFKNYS